jgi:type I restriction enzyme S subunit
MPGENQGMVCNAMTDDLKPYPSYTDSEFDWLGRLPEHWGMRSLGSMISSRSERKRPDLPLLSVVRERGVILRSSMAGENHNVIPEDLSNYKVVRKGDLAINKMKAWQGSLGIAPHEGIVSPAYYVYRLQGIGEGYAHVLLRSRPYVAFFGRASDGVRVAQWDLSIDGMKRIPVPIPSPEEQAAIVRYIDHLDHKINRFIRAKKKQIDLVNEEKTIIIHRVISRGLDSSQELKATGLPWLGEVPQSWQVLRVRRLISFITSGSRGWAKYYSDDGDLFLQSGNLARTMSMKLDSALLNFEWVAGSSRLCLGMRIDG